MNCLNCGALLDESPNCPKCGMDVVAQKRVYLLSNQYYNMGLEKAEIRDLSGAIDLLKRSLKLNKVNIQARNLLGLVYFEVGEAVAALSEWVISKNIMPNGNVASEYIARLQANKNKLDVINQSIKKYNEALICCRNGSSDTATIQLKRILSENPKFIKAYHLLALNYINDNAYEKARKILKKAARIDKTNSTTLRFLREVDEQTGTQTSLESRWGRGFKLGKDAGSDFDAGTQSVIVPTTFRESSIFSSFLNIGVGLAIGALAVWFLMVPANTQRINREANNKVTEYSNSMASQSARVKEMEEEIKNSNETVKTAQEQIAEAAEKATSYENLIKAFSAYQAENYENAANAMMEVKPELLSVDAKALYDSISGEIKSIMFNKYKADGINAHDNADYKTAIDLLNKAIGMDNTDFDVMNYLALSYKADGDNVNAIKWFKEIINKDPGTSRAESAQYYINEMGGGETPNTDEQPPAVEAETPPDVGEDINPPADADVVSPDVEEGLEPPADVDVVSPEEI